MQDKVLESVLPCNTTEHQLTEIRKSIDFLSKENQLLGQYIARVCPLANQADDGEAKVTKKKSQRRAKPDPKQIRALTAEEKNDIVTSEMEVQQAQTAAIRSKGEKDINEIKVLIEEVAMRMAEAKKQTYEFKRDIIMGGDNPRTGKIISEKFMRFWRDHLKSRDAQLEKMSLKNASLRQQIMKLNQQLSHKEEMGEVLHVVDFEQLKIENQQYMNKLEDKNKALLSLKLTTSNTVQILNSLKHELSVVLSHGEFLGKEIDERERQASRFDKEFKTSNNQQKKAERMFKRLKFQQEDVEQPQINDYLNVKAEVMELEHKVVDWKRKIEIADMENARLTRVLSRLPPGASLLSKHKQP